MRSSGSCVWGCRCRPAVVIGSQERERVASLDDPSHRTKCLRSRKPGSVGFYALPSLEQAACRSDSRSEPRLPWSMVPFPVPTQHVLFGHSFSRAPCTHSKSLPFFIFHLPPSRSMDSLALLLLHKKSHHNTRQINTG